MLTEAQLAAELQISTRQVQRYTAAGMAPAVYLWAGRRGRPLSAQVMHHFYTGPRRILNPIALSSICAPCRPITSAMVFEIGHFLPKGGRFLQTWKTR